MSKDILIYGANGYTAEIIVQLAKDDGVRVIVAGRSEAKLAPVAARSGLPMRVFALDDAAAVAQNLADVGVVLNCAGPFSRTAAAMAEGCLRAGVHYLDITGELEVFETLAKMGKRAEAAGVMFMPGTGFDVVPSDCLAAHLKRRMPDATSLTLAIQAISQPSRGTATTMAENLHRGGAVRRGGKLTPVPAAWATRQIDFGRGLVPTVSIPWGDVATAWVSTGIPDITVFMAAPAPLRFIARASRYLGAVMGSGFVQRLLHKQIAAGPAGPSAEQRKRGASHVWGEVRNDAGQAASARLDTIEGYALTALTAWDIARRTVNGEVQPGFRTPSMVYGADYILNFAGTVRTDL